MAKKKHNLPVTLFVARVKDRDITYLSADPTTEGLMENIPDNETVAGYYELKKIVRLKQTVNLECIEVKNPK